jgi:hypothetical protein
MFGLIQDGTPVSSTAQLELLGRLPQPESLLLLQRRDHPINTFADLRGAAIGIGPEGSGTAYLMRQLFDDQDLKALDVRLSHHELQEQAKLLAERQLDLAAFVMQEDAPFARMLIRQHGLDIAAPQDLQGLVARYPWLSLGRIPAGRYDLVSVIPPTDKLVARVATLVVANRCAQRADRIALLMLLGAELPGFVHDNPPTSIGSATAMPLAPEAQQFFLTGQPEFADRYFPWLVNLLSPAYWVYLIMAATVLFNALKAYSRFRLWRIDAGREKLEAAFNQIAGRSLTYGRTPANLPEQAITTPEARAAAETILVQLADLRRRSQRQASSVVTPMGDEMFYRFQESLIDDTTNTLMTMLGRAPRKV